MQKDLESENKIKKNTEELNLSKVIEAASIFLRNKYRNIYIFKKQIQGV